MQAKGRMFIKTVKFKGGSLPSPFGTQSQFIGSLSYGGPYGRQSKTSEGVSGRPFNHYEKKQ